MVLLAKALGAGLGFASEAIHAARGRSSSGQDVSSDGHYKEETAKASKDASVNTDHSNQAAYQDGETPEDTGHDYLDGIDQDEAAWQLDETVERLRPPTDKQEVNREPESKEAKVKKREAMVHELIALTGPAQSKTRLSCPVIIPQRRPRKKNRGFVRAYAPGLADCGISQECFLQFLENLDKANEVRSVICSHSPHLQQLTISLGLEVDRSSVYRCRDCKQHPNSSGYSSRNRGAGHCRHSSRTTNATPGEHFPRPGQSGAVDATRTLCYDNGVQR
jgi:hypothetical protein